MMQKSKMGDCYVRDIKSSPDPAIVVASDGQLDDLVRFCASPTGVESCVMTIDPTFCLGEFECTPVTYRHLLLITRRNKTPPVFMGPVLIHYRKIFLVLCLHIGIIAARTAVCTSFWVRW